MKKLFFAFGIFVFFSCVYGRSVTTGTNKGKEVYKSDSLVINQISEHVYQHISFLDTKDFGKVSCNGMIVACKDEAVVFDTPIDDETSRELIDWVTRSLKYSR